MYFLATVAVDLNVHPDAGYTSWCASVLSVKCVRKFVA